MNAYTFMSPLATLFSEKLDLHFLVCGKWFIYLEDGVILCGECSALEQWPVPILSSKPLSIQHEQRRPALSRAVEEMMRHWALKSPIICQVLDSEEPWVFPSLLCRETQDASLQPADFPHTLTLSSCVWPWRWLLSTLVAVWVHNICLLEYDNPSHYWYICVLVRFLFLW